MSTSAKDRKLITALAVRNQGSRLYGKPFQNLHIESSKTILSNIIECLDTVDCIDQTVLGIAEGVDNISTIFLGASKMVRFFPLLLIKSGSTGGKSWIFWVVRFFFMVRS